MSFGEQVTARFEGPVQDGFITHCATHVREADLAVEETVRGLLVTLPQARVELTHDDAGFSVSIGATDAAALHQIREYLLYLLDHIEPGAAPKLAWTGSFARDGAPPNFHTATVCSVRRVAPRFLRVELDCAGTARLAGGKGMHFTLLLPPADRVTAWPRLDGDGRTVWPQGDDSLHRAAYTFVDLDPETGRFTFDVFEHEGGRTTLWAETATPGREVGIMGPGGGGFPAGDRLLMAGDETALPAIRRILATSAPDRQGEVFIEVAGETDTEDLPRPPGMTLAWAIRDRGEALWDRLQDHPGPQGDAPFIWIAAEQDLVRKAKARFRRDLGFTASEAYIAYYWTA